MNRRRYDDVLRFVASILFGTSFRQFHDVIDSLGAQLCSEGVAKWTAIIFFALFFRNVHGLMAHDTWAEHSRYEPPFELRSRWIIVNFCFGFLVAILSPYLFIYVLTSHKGAKPFLTLPLIFDSYDIPLGLFLFAPLFLYFPWNIGWLWALKKRAVEAPSKINAKSTKIDVDRQHHPFPWAVRLRTFVIFKGDQCFTKAFKVLIVVENWTGNSVNRLFKTLRIPPYWQTLSWEEPERKSLAKYQAYRSIVDFTILWSVIDVFALVAIAIGYWRIRHNYSLPDLYLLFSLVTGAALLLDYASHIHYYFPAPLHPPNKHEPSEESYQFGKVWNYILPDGIEFCHWGGKRISERVIELLEPIASDSILELCCGHGGTLGLFPSDTRLVGVDNSQGALNAAEIQLKGRNVTLLNEDLRKRLPFKNGEFTKVFSQDADIWMHSDMHVILTEVYRVTAKGGLFLFQNYVRSSAMPEEDLNATDEILQTCGYPECNVPELDELPKRFQLAGFRIERVVPLHQEYLEDNERMLTCFRANQKANVFSEKDSRTFEQLLTHEQKLFRNGWWTGILIVARKI